MSNLSLIVNFRKCMIFLVLLFSMPLNSSSLNGGSLEPGQNGQTDSSQQMFRRDGK